MIAVATARTMASRLIGGSLPLALAFCAPVGNLVPFGWSGFCSILTHVELVGSSLRAAADGRMKAVNHEAHPGSVHDREPRDGCVRRRHPTICLQSNRTGANVHLSDGYCIRRRRHGPVN